MMLAFLFTATAIAGAQQAEPREIGREPKLGDARPATSWNCDFTDAAGAAIVLKGRFPEAPAGWDPDKELLANVTGLAPAHLLGEKRVKVLASAPDVRGYQLTSDAPEGVRYTLNFQFIRDAGSLANVSRYTPPMGEKAGQMVAFATGYCSSKFHATGEKEAES